VYAGAADRVAGTQPARRKWLPFIAPLRLSGIFDVFVGSLSAVSAKICPFGFQSNHRFRVAVLIAKPLD
jgi:hypothetical protein